jgi:preprotein translocase subunit SecG
MLRGLMSDIGRRARLLRVTIWLATLFFAAMLFLPLVREVLRRLQESPSGGAF